MSAELAILNKAKNQSGCTKVIFKEDYDVSNMLDVSSNFFDARDSTGVHDIFEDGSAVATYQFDNDVTDLGGTYDGVPTNVTYDVGKYNEASVYNGASSVVDCNINNAVEIDCVSIWFNTTVPTDTEFNCIGMMNQSDGYNWIALGNGSGELTDETLSVLFYTQPSTPEFAYIKDEIGLGWHNMVFQWETDAYYIYLDGTKRTTLYYGSPNIRRPLDLILGRRYGAENYFDGQLDQVRIFNRALTADEVTALYNEYTPPSVTGTVTQPSENTHDIFKDESALATYQFDGDATDLGGNYNLSASNLTYENGKFNQSAHFNGTSSIATVSIPSTENITISHWMQVVETTWTMDAISYGVVSPNETGILMHYGKPSGTFYVGDSGSGWEFISTGPTYDVGTWFHTSLVVDNTNLKVSLYFDGVLWQEGSITAPIAYSDDIFRIGTSIWNNSNDYKLMNIDQVRFFNRALTEGEITQVFNEKTPKSILEEPAENTHDIFEDGSALATYQFNGDVTDLGGVYDGVNSGVTFTDGVFNECGVFNGSSYITENTITVGSSTTYTSWCTPSDIGSTFPDYQSPIFSVRGNSDAFSGYTLTFANDSNKGSHYVLLMNRDDTIVKTTLYDANFVWTPLQLYFIVLVIDETIISVFIDDVLILQYELSVPYSVIEIGIEIGKERSHSDYFYTGKIDQVRIFNRALTAKEINTLYTETVNPYKIVVMR